MVEDLTRFRLDSALYKWVIPGLAFMPDRLNTLARRQIVLGTGSKESNYIHTRQLNGGPALSYWQIEPATHDDLWRNFLAHRPELFACAIKAAGRSYPRASLLLDNPAYSAFISGMIYFRSPLALPTAFDAFGQAAMWKKVYNGPGKGVMSEAVQYFRAANEVAK